MARSICAVGDISGLILTPLVPCRERQPDRADDALRIEFPRDLGVGQRPLDQDPTAPFGRGLADFLA